MVTDRGTYVRSTYCVLYRTVYCERIRENPGAIYDCWQRSKPHLLCRKDHLLDEQPRGDNLPQTMSGLERRAGTRGSSTAFAWGILSQVAKEQASCRSRQHREVDVLRFQDSGVG